MVSIKTVERYFKGRFKVEDVNYITSGAPTYKNNKFSSKAQFKIKDNNDGEIHNVILINISNKELINAISNIVIDKRNDTLDNIINYYG